MKPSNNVTSAICEAIVEGLEVKKLATSVSVEMIEEIVAPLLPPVSGFRFTEDSEFLNSSIEHHITEYFHQVMRPKVKTFMTNKTMGRLMTDKEVNEASIDITTKIIAETGVGYRLHMFRYFGDTEGLTAYVYSRVYSMLIREAEKFNDEWLSASRSKGS